ncbi:hypothetical protein LX36DRAFT_276555 [Colletotrichum falcatum]|nr:hypothetical protein LX36DRAFT_276555 [Colletotrichum falcatum]
MGRITVEIIIKALVRGCPLCHRLSMQPRCRNWPFMAATLTLLGCFTATRCDLSCRPSKRTLDNEFTKCDGGIHADSGVARTMGSETTPRWGRKFSQISNTVCPVSVNMCRKSQSVSI